MNIVKLMFIFIRGSCIGGDLALGLMEVAVENHIGLACEPNFSSQNFQRPFSTPKFLFFLQPKFLMAFLVISSLETTLPENAMTLPQYHSCQTSDPWTRRPVNKIQCKHCGHFVMMESIS